MYETPIRCDLAHAVDMESDSPSVESLTICLPHPYWHVLPQAGKGPAPMRLLYIDAEKCHPRFTNELMACLPRN